MPIACQRQRFDLPPEVTYLNCAYMGPLSHEVLTAARQGLARKARPWKIEAPDFFTEVEQARSLFASLVGGDAEGVSLLPSVSYGIATAARNLPLARGAEIIVLEDQFPSNLYAWRELAGQAAGRVKTVSRPTDGDWTSAVLQALGPATGIAALPHCHWTDGTLVDLEAVSHRLRQLGAALVVDACQSLGALPLDVGRVQPDFVVTGAYKWLLGPYSHGLMWVAPRWRQGRPLEHNWIAREKSHDFTALVSYTDRFSPGARRFDVGEVSNFALLPATIAALRQCLAWGVAEIQETLRRLTDGIAAHAADLGLGVPPADRRAGHMIGLRLSGQDPRKLAAKLAAARVYVSVRGDSVRVAPHVYNDREDILRFNHVLSAAIGVGSHGRGSRSMSRARSGESAS